MIKFSVWLENKIKARRSISDAEMDQIVTGEPYTSPQLGRVNFLRDSGRPIPELGAPITHPEDAYFQHYMSSYGRKSKKPSKDRAWVLGLEIPEEDREMITPLGGGNPVPYEAVPALEPYRHIKTITRIDKKGTGKPRDAKRFIDLHKGLFGNKENR
jgi:hypothetical protein